LFRKILGVNVVSDRKDISDKLIRMFNSIDRDTKLSRKAAQIIDRQEGIQADCVALYVSATAGYSPRGSAELFDRSAGTNGSSSSILTDFYGTTTSSLGHLREIKIGLEAAPTTLPGNGSSRVARVPHMASRGHIGPRFRPMVVPAGMKAEQHSPAQTVAKKLFCYECAKRLRVGLFYKLV